MSESLTTEEQREIASSILSLGMQDREAVLRLLFLDGAPGLEGLTVLCPWCRTVHAKEEMYAHKCGKLPPW